MLFRSRYSSLLNYRCIGGLSKLLNYFIKKYNPQKIISYADMRYTDCKSNLYKSIGFKLIKSTKPNYFYTNNYKNKLHRFNFTKQKLVKMGHDKNKTEWQIMQELGYDRIWDCGHYKYEWNVE